MNNLMQSIHDYFDGFNADLDYFYSRAREFVGPDETIDDMSGDTWLLILSGCEA